MKQKFFYMVVMIIGFFYFSNNAMAAFSFNLSSDYSVGDSQVVFDLNLTTDEIISELGCYSFEFTYDTNELSYVGYTNTPVTGLIADMFGPLTNNAEDGTLDKFAAASFGDVSVDAGKYLLGTFTFDVTNAVADGEVDFNFDLDDPMFGYTMLGADGPIPGHFPSSTLDIAPEAGGTNPVPIPAALWLFGSGIVGLACCKRRQAT